jgi:hypothetical protein
LRITWRDSQPEDQSTPLAWTSVAMITATLFLNFSLWMEYADSLRMPGPFPLFGAVLIAASLLLTALFFLGPALASHRARRPLFDVIESSLGSIPGWGVRLVVAWFLLNWVAFLVAVPASQWVTFILRREVSRMESGVIAAGILVFILLTGLQSFRSNAKLAFFTNKLAIAILIAALIRVRPGLPAAFAGYRRYVGDYSTEQYIRQGLSQLAFYLAPLLFLAAGFGFRLPGRKQLAKVAINGIAMPLGGVLLVVGLIDLATYTSGYYQPSVKSNVAIALWGKAALSTLPPRIMLVSITMFGAARFALRMLRDALWKPPVGRVAVRLLLGLIGVAIVWSAVYSSDWDLFDNSTRLFGPMAAVLSADYMMGERKSAQPRRFDWIGFGALTAGMVASFAIQPAFDAFSHAWWQPAALPSYGAAFLTCLFGRVLQRMGTSRSARKLLESPSA